MVETVVTLFWIVCDLFFSVFTCFTLFNLFLLTHFECVNSGEMCNVICCLRKKEHIRLVSRKWFKLRVELLSCMWLCGSIYNYFDFNSVNSSPDNLLYWKLSRFYVSTRNRFKVWSQHWYCVVYSKWLFSTLT